MRATWKKGVCFTSCLFITPMCYGSDGKKNPPSMQEVPVRSLGWEDSPEKEMATHSSILAWRIPWAEEPGRLQSLGSQGVGHNQWTIRMLAVF